LMLALINLVSLHVSAILFSYLTTLSVMPVTREERVGVSAWEDCARIRYISFVFAAIMWTNTLLWIWLPVPELSWTISPNHSAGIILGIVISIPCLVILAVALRDAGEEMHAPKRDTKLHGGIYRVIRHPGALGEMPLYVVLALFTNSLFLTLWMLGFVLVFTPIHIHFEEKDLEKRFGSEYLEYKRRTPALIPGFRRSSRTA
jgi:protein-S-isoprenylcysteine O-methyltransferase Ste14